MYVITSATSTHNKQYDLNVFVFTEVPDVALDLLSNQLGARWVLLEWTPAFDGNSDILFFRVIITPPISENPIAVEMSSTRYVHVHVYTFFCIK